ncbi:MarR family winged helix-turn-helix transcriptional regulator [Mucilaginibacter dorajii]|uniref:HTH marR-type domain-containing protein n=1 Tax=Mucilaginibacter dorajii TaxID=692994 RepID=A0ABP7QCF3_9SPHI|nr:MarR family winged helix-turn-helix transcriptional regulator [Mucilaginibacter dorajii]MCS3733193.1 DNA-binding MarR family transcriptional regulator [Mucilaginibacter dorajii]
MEISSKLPVQQIRAFSRFYTDIIGLLDKHLLQSDYSLAEARILYEINAASGMQASQIIAAMYIDKSYLSRLLKKLEKDKLIIKKPSQQDARASILSLTDKGMAEFMKLNQASDVQINDLIKKLSAEKQQELVSHMQQIMNILKQK